MFHCSSTIIDDIFTNSTVSDITCGNILSQTSDHFPQFLILKGVKTHHKTMASFKRDHSSFNLNSFIANFNKMDITYIEVAPKLIKTARALLRELTLS